MVIDKTFEITVLFEEVIVMFTGVLARAGMFVELWSCTARRESSFVVLRENIIVSPSGTVAEMEDGAGIAVERLVEEVAYPLVVEFEGEFELASAVELMSAVTFAVPCRIPAVTLTTAKVWPAGITASATLTIPGCEEVRLTGISDAATAGELNASSSESSRAACVAPSAGRGEEMALRTTCEGTAP
jgi:hypothetical protein